MAPRSPTVRRTVRHVSSLVVLTAWCLPSSAADLFRDDFSSFPPGWLTRPVGQLNAAIHVAAVTQARDPGPGRDHYRRKITEHKTTKEARRSLKRRISNAIYRRILADQQRLQLEAA